MRSDGRYNHADLLILNFAPADEEGMRALQTIREADDAGAPYDPSAGIRIFSNAQLA